MVSCGLNLCFLFEGELKETGSTLEVVQRKDRSQSLSNVDILISPCEPIHTPPSTGPASPSSESRYEDKIPLGAASSFPLGKPRVTQHSSFSPPGTSGSSHRKSIDIIHSPASKDQGPLLQTVRSPSMPLLLLSSKGESDQDGDTADVHIVEAESSEDLEDDRTYPTLRSKSLNTKPSTTKTKEVPRSASSVKDLVAAFGEVTGEGLQSRTRSRESNWPTVSQSTSGSR